MVRSLRSGFFLGRPRFFFCLTGLTVGPPEADFTLFVEFIEFNMGSVYRQVSVSASRLECYHVLEHGNKGRVEEESVVGCRCTMRGMIVYYRLTPKESRYEEQRPIYKHNKYELSKFCLRSFVQAFSTIKPKIVFLMDECPVKWEKMVREIVPNAWEVEVVNVEKSGQDKSYLVQLELAREQSTQGGSDFGVREDEIVWFQEDDYYYLPGSEVGEKILSAVQELGFVNPYDHGEFYIQHQYHPSGPYEIKLVDEHHWRTVRFNTMTWGTSVKLLKKHWETLIKYGYWDKPTWEAMLAKGVPLWSPIPTLATHMHSEWLSPGINWKEHWNVE